MKKVLALLLVFILAIASLSACSNSGKNDPAEEKPIDELGDISLTLWIGYPEFDSWLAKMGEEYHKLHPNVTVTSTSFNLRDFETKLSVSVPAKTAADIVSIDPAWFTNFVNSGYAQKAPQNVIDFLDSGIFDKAPLDYSKGADGVYYAVPSLQSAGGIYYNKDYWAEAGLTDADAPKSLSDIVALSKKLAKFDDAGNLVRSGVSLRVAGGGSGICEKFWMWEMQEGGSIVKEVGDGKYVPNYNNDAGFDTLKMYVDILWGDKTCNYDIGSDSSGFEAGVTAMFMREQWVIPDIAANSPDLNYGVWPTWNASLYQSNNYFVLIDPKETAKSRVAWDFLLFIVGNKEYQTEQATMSGWLSARNDCGFEGVPQEIMNGFSTAGKTVHAYPQLGCYDEIQTKLAERFSNVGFNSPDFYGDDAKIHAFLDECEKETISILKENGVYGGN